MNGNRWTEREHNVLISMWDEGLTDHHIAAKLTAMGTPRTIGAVKTYRRKLRIMRKPPPSTVHDDAHLFFESENAKFDAAFVAAMHSAGYSYKSRPFAAPDDLEIPQRIVPARAPRTVGSLGSGWQL